MLGHHQPASEMPSKWRFAGGPIMARFYWYWILSPLIKKNIRVGPPLTKLSGSAHDACLVSRPIQKQKCSEGPGLLT